MKTSALELREMLEEDGYKRRDVVTSFKGRADRLPVFRIRETHPDRLIDEEDVRVLAPGVHERLRAVGASNSARTFKRVIDTYGFNTRTLADY